MIIDTNAVSALAEGDPSIATIVQGAEILAVPAIVLGEYRLGIARSRYRTAYENWLAGWTGSVTVLNVDEETSEAYAAIGIELRVKGKPIPTNDLWIAALSRQHFLPILSKDRHFDAVSGLKRIEW